MKINVAASLLALLLVLPAISKAQDSFSAEMANVRRGSKMVYMVQSNGSMYRYDFEESGMKGTVIVNPEKKITAILMPDKKFVHYTETSSSTSRSNDPVQSLMTIKERYTEKNLGKEKISGYNCEKSELYADDEKVFSLWFSEDLNFPLRIVNHMGSDTYMELSGIKEHKIDPSVFEVSKDYTEVDDRMRPIIPEPPAPDSWNTIQSDLPLSGEYNRGDLIKISVPESRNYIITLTNLTADPTKVIRKSFREGMELPNNEQGPLKYRTDRLFNSESFKNTYIWKAGDVKIIEVHEGKIRIEVRAENR